MSAHQNSRLVSISNLILVCVIAGFLAIAFLRTIIWNPDARAVRTHWLPDNPKKTIMFVHGWSGSPQSWDPAIRLALDDLRLRDFEILSVSYPTFMSGRGYSLAELSSWFASELASVSKGRRVLIVAHSMGGVVVRRAILLNAIAGLPLSVDVIISAGSPYLGANTVELGRVLAKSESLYGELKADSPTIRALRLDWAAFIASGRAASVRSVCIASTADLVVPPYSAQSQCDESLMYPMWGHTELTAPNSTTDARYTTIVRYLLSSQAP